MGHNPLINKFAKIKIIGKNNGVCFTQNLDKLLLRNSNTHRYSQLLTSQRTVYTSKRRYFDTKYMYTNYGDAEYIMPITRDAFLSNYYPCVMFVSDLNQSKRFAIILYIHDDIMIQ